MKHRIPVTQVVIRPRGFAPHACVRFPVATTPDVALAYLINMHAPKGF